MPKVKNSRVTSDGTGTILYTDDVDPQVVETATRTASVRGPRGPAGPRGEDGTDGVDGTNGTNGRDGINGTNGRDGVNGVDGRDGVDGTNGQDGANGIDGVNGEDGAPGKSAYDLAVDNGYVGDVIAWLLTLVGPRGTAGAQGQSAYEVAVGDGFEGTITEWLATLHGGGTVVSGPASTPSIWYELINDVYLDSSRAGISFMDVKYRSDENTDDTVGYIIDGEATGGVATFVPASDGLYRFEYSCILNSMMASYDQSNYRNSIVTLYIDSTERWYALGDEYHTTTELIVDPSNFYPVATTTTPAVTCALVGGQEYQLRVKIDHAPGVSVTDPVLKAGSAIKISRLSDVTPSPLASKDTGTAEFIVTFDFTTNSLEMSFDNPSEVHRVVETNYMEMDAYLNVETTAPSGARPYVNQYWLNYGSTDFTSIQFGEVAMDIPGTSWSPAETWDDNVTALSLQVIDSSEESSRSHLEFTLPVLSISNYMQWRITVDLSTRTKEYTAEQIISLT